MKYILVPILSLFFFVSLPAQTRQLKLELEEYINDIPSSNMNIDKMTIRRIEKKVSQKTLRLVMYPNILAIPFRNESLDTIVAGLSRVARREFPDYKVELYVNEKNVENLIPNYYNTEKDESRVVSGSKVGNVVTPLSRQGMSGEAYGRGLQGRNVALWQSHGVYYKQQEDRWVWQRARLFTTVEDRFSTSFVIPYLLPMLENSGANVFLPRERDLQSHEVIVDNDGGAVSEIVASENTRGYNEIVQGYREIGKGFSDGSGKGFAHNKTVYIDNDNPFESGTYRVLETANKETSFVEFIPLIPEEGEYSVWVSYKSLENSVTDAHYTVYHAGGSSEFSVNQKMGGGTWIYLGKFHFNQGINPKTARVELSNVSSEVGVVTIDAVRFGGGMGNVARRMSTNADLLRYKEKYPKSKTKLIGAYPKEDYTTSGYSRFWEGSRYWLQWAGAPDSVYSYMMGLNDYIDDFSSRGLWVNWLNQGSVYAPDSAGLAIPLDLSLAFHTNAGIHLDTIYGTLGIYRTQLNDDSKKQTFPNGKSRLMSRDLTDLVMTSVCDDIRKTCNADWVRRMMWDKSYSECRRPEVPSMILELLSHQNLEDMKLGLDPRFKFIVSRAIYKGILRFIHQAYDLGDCVVHPLPVRSFSSELVASDSVRLSWRERVDSLESTALPTAYVVHTRIGGGWDNGVLVDDTTLTLPIEQDKIYSYKVVALNEGGLSMDSEILSVCSRSEAKGFVYIINGFDRLGAPESFQIDSSFGGFSNNSDMGVPLGVDIQYCGSQYEYDIRTPWISDDASGWGACHSDKEKTLVVGNTFDYPRVHGQSFYNIGYSFASSSAEAVERGVVDLTKYNIVDLILGEQKHVAAVDDNYFCDNTTFSANMQIQLRQYLSKGKSLFVSGAFVASGMLSSEQDKAFVKNVLKFDYSTKRGSESGKIKSVYSPCLELSGKYTYSNQLNDSIYCVEAPDAISAIKNVSFIVMRYDDNEKGAAVVYDGNYKVFTSAIPFETILTQQARDAIMEQVVNFFKGTSKNCFAFI